MIWRSRSSWAWLLRQMMYGRIMLACSTTSPPLDLNQVAAMLDNLRSIWPACTPRLRYGTTQGDIDQETWRSLRDRDGQARRLSDLRVGAQPTSVTFFAWSNGGRLRLTAAVDSPARNR